MTGICARNVPLSLLVFAVGFAACSAQKSDTSSQGAQPTQATQAVGAATDSAPSTAAPTSGQGNTTAASTAQATPVLTPVCSGGAADVNIVITSKAGPLGGAPTVISNKLYSMNIDDQVPADYLPTLNANFVAYLKALRPALLRWPPGYYSQTYQFTTTGSGPGAMTPALIDAFMGLCTAVGAKPLMGVNIGTGTAANAAQWVQFVNGTRKYGVTWWQIGNEPNLGSTSTSVTTAFTNYPSTYLTYRNAMLAVDPTVKFVGLESYQGMAIYRDNIDRGEADFFTPFLAQVGDQVDAVAWHYYQLYSGDATANTSGSSALNITNLFQESASDWPPAGLTFADDIIPYMRTKMASVVPKAQIWIDEFAEDSGNQLAGRGVADTVAGALWAADVTGRYADQGTDGIFHFIFKAAGTSSLQFGYTLLDPNNDPRPEYYAFWLMSNHYGDQMVKTATSSITTVASHAALSSADGSLHVMLVNKSTTAQAVHLNLADYRPVRASQYVLSGPSMAATSVAINGKTLTPDIATLGDAAIASATAQACIDNTFTVPALSVNMVIFTTK